MTIQIRILCTKPQLCGPILRTDINQASIEGNCEGVLRVLKANIGVHHLSFFSCEERVGTDKVYLRAGTEDVGDDSSTVFVGVDLGEKPLCK